MTGTDYRGAVAFAPAPNFGPLLSGLRGSTDPLVQESLLMLLTGLYTRTPFHYARVLGPRARAELAPTCSACFDDLTKIIAAARIPGRDILPRASELPPAGARAAPVRDRPSPYVAPAARAAGRCAVRGGLAGAARAPGLTSRGNRG